MVGVLVGFAVVDGLCVFIHSSLAFITFVGCWVWVWFLWDLNMFVVVWVVGLGGFGVVSCDFLC